MGQVRHPARPGRGAAGGASLSGAGHRLLLSARDAGAAHQIGALAHHLAGHGNFVVTLAAMGPAVSILRDLGLAPLEVKLPPAARPADAAAVDLLRAAGELLEGCRADAIVTGLSGPGLGLDEALLARAGGRPTYALQDYWGDVNPGFGRTARTFFVADREAARLTRARIACRTVVCGSPRHAGLAAPAAAPAPWVLFCGQPLWHLRGYARTLRRFAGALAGHGWPLRYRPHPAEPAARLREALDLMTANGTVVEDDSGPLDESLATARVVASCYSSCALDLAYLNRLAPRPLGGAVCLLFEPDVREWFRSYSGLESLPLAGLGLALEVGEDEALDAALDQAADPAWQARCRSRAGEMLPDPEQAAQIIAETLAGDLETID